MHTHVFFFFAKLIILHVTLLLMIFIETSSKFKLYLNHICVLFGIFHILLTMSEI
jgi:hypothetical protein